MKYKQQRFKDDLQKGFQYGLFTRGGSVDRVIALYGFYRAMKRHALSIPPLRAIEEAKQPWLLQG